MEHSPGQTAYWLTNQVLKHFLKIEIISSILSDHNAIRLDANLGFSGGSAGEESACSARDQGLIPGLGRSPRRGKGYPL